MEPTVCQEPQDPRDRKAFRAPPASMERLVLTASMALRDQRVLKVPSVRQDPWGSRDQRVLLVKLVWMASMGCSVPWGQQVPSVRLDSRDPWAPKVPMASTELTELAVPLELRDPRVQLVSMALMVLTASMVYPVFKDYRASKARRERQVLKETLVQPVHRAFKDYKVRLVVMD